MTFVAVTVAVGLAHAGSAAAVTQYKQVSANGAVSCGVVSDGSVKCWGSNGDGMLGVPYDSLSKSSIPVTVPGVSGAAEVKVGGNHVCARVSGGSVTCWGLNSEWQIGSRQECKLNQYGELYLACFYWPTQCDCVHGPTPVPGVSGAIQITSGSQHSCALISGGSVTCWGNNWHGEVGDGTARPYPIIRYWWDPRPPSTVVDVSNATQISAGGEKTCARLSSGQVKCWGSNLYGALGNGSKGSQMNSTPSSVVGISTATQVWVGGEMACALLSDKSIKCWGSDVLGNGSTTGSNTPVAVFGISNALQVAGHCALLSTRTVKCWGNNSQGNVGDGTTTDRMTPVAVSGLTSVTSLADQGLCARLGTGGVKCWGLNDDGQVGDGTTTTRLSPVPVYDTPTADSDTDGDGLPDGWESEPVDLTGDGKPDLDLPAMGADPEHKDLFVELDAMPGLRLSQDAIGGVVKAFNDSPVSNPEGQPGIRLHVDNGPSSVMNPLTGERWGSLSKANEIPWKAVMGSGWYDGSGDLTDYNWTEFDSVKAANFDPIRARVFRYALSVNRYGDAKETSGGLARGLGTTDFFVSLGSWCRPEGRCLPGTLAQGGAFMHELGHTLGLRHGGNDNINNKPNYLSVMNYLFNISGVLRSDLPRGQGVLDYSGFGPSELPDLDEHQLVESAGLSTSAKLANYMTVIYRFPSGFLAPASGPVDFNADGDTLDTVSKNINGDLDVHGNSIGSILGTLRTFADWPNLKYQAGGIGSAGAPPALPMKTEVNEPPMDVLMRFANIAAPPPVVNTTSATSITQTSAKLNGTVNPTGQATDVQFTYGTTTDNTKLTAFTSAGRGTKTIPFTKTITGLVGDTTYTVRAAARTGTQLIYGSPITFKTAACSKLTTRAQRQKCVLEREQYKCQTITNPTQKATCLTNATATANRTQ